MKKVPYEVINEIKDHIDDFWLKENMSVEVQLGCFGDENRIYIDGKKYSLECTEYYAKDIQDIKTFFENYISSLWENSTLPYHRIVIHIDDIIDMDGWYNVIVGGCLYEDGTLKEDFLLGRL